MEKKKLKTCKACGAEVAKSAKVCPHCGAKIKKPIYQRAWFIVLVVIFLFSVIGGGSKKNSSDDLKVGEVTPANTQTPENNAPIKTESENTKTEYKVGDTLQDGDMKIVYVASGNYTSDNQFSQPAEGNKFIFLKFAFENTGKTDNAISFYDFECYADGYSTERYYGGSDDLSATLSAGRSTEGYLYFEVPENAENIEIEYTTNYFTSKKINFVYEGEADSGYELPKNNTATEGAYKVGDVIEANGITIQYLACNEYKSSNQFIQPKSGYHFVQIELEFENTSSSDELVSSILFNCYADGVACNQSYIGDNDLSANISPGRKTKGSVIFEVPNDAEIVEVEFNHNVWTSSKIVFSVEY